VKKVEIASRSRYLVLLAEPKMAKSQSVVCDSLFFAQYFVIYPTCQQPFTLNVPKAVGQDGKF
jgi:hypothetical protein